MAERAPPTLTPTSSGAHSPVKCESSTAAGTLLMTWLAPALTHRPPSAMSGASTSTTCGMRAMFPANTQKHAKVSSSP